jgi:CheY-like chemotaxis protein
MKDVVVVGKSPEKMEQVKVVLSSYGFAATGVYSEQEALQVIADHDDLFGVVAGGSVDQTGRKRLEAAAASKGAVLVTANIGHDDPALHFTKHVVPKLIAARDRPPR